MRKHVAVLLMFAVLTVGCARLPFSNVDSEPTPVTFQDQVDLTSFQQTEPDVSSGTEEEAPPESPLPVFLLPENSQSTGNRHNSCDRSLNSDPFKSCAPPQTAVPGN